MRTAEKLPTFDALYEQIRALPAGIAAAQDEDAQDLPPFEGAIEICRWWLPLAAPPPVRAADDR